MTAGGGVAVIFAQALTTKWGGVVLLISTAGQLYCTVACMTSTTRMLFAFSRDGAVPGGRYWSRLNSNRVPVYGVMSVVALVEIVLTSIVALLPTSSGGHLSVKHWFPGPKSTVAPAPGGRRGLADGGAALARRRGRR